MLKLLQYCNYIIIVMQIKLMLLLLLLSMPSSCPQPMAIVAVFPNRLSFSWFHYGFERRNDDDRGN